MNCKQLPEFTVTKGGGTAHSGLERIAAHPLLEALHEVIIEVRHDHTQIIYILQGELPNPAPQTRPSLSLAVATCLTTVLLQLLSFATRYAFASVVQRWVFPSDACCEWEEKFQTILHD
jgi:hypothetical protein